MAYTGLKYKSRSSASPQGRPRVYFCCHKSDFDRLFDTVTDEILNIQDNAIFWYHDPAEGTAGEETFFADLGQMQLFVVPVTSAFLYRDDPARTVEFQYAVDHHIPVLPLMQEPDLAEDFNRICGDIQFLDKNALQSDPTAIPYEEKLKTFLESVLVSDELAQKVREAFDAYIFLSYRKKDRAYAQQIMRLIHENDFCRDIAIWYDEFLTPGENFNEAISAAMKKSRLFALVVTPSLLEVPNYVMDIEYPEAKTAGKPILPIEAAATDEKEFKRLFAGISPSVFAGDPQTVSARLSNILRSIALRENDSDPAHNFLIGLAYLSGIDVEVDHDRAVGLITSAANAGLPEACEKLVVMHRAGEGVPRDYHVAVDWQGKYVDCLRKIAEGEKTDENIDNVYHALNRLGNDLLELEDFKGAEAAYEDLAGLCRSRPSSGSDKVMGDLAHAYTMLGWVSCQTGRFADAEHRYLEALKIRKEIAGRSDSSLALRDLVEGYDSLGLLYEDEEKYAEAKECYEKEAAICEALTKRDLTAEGMDIRSSLCVTYYRLGRICLKMTRPVEAADWGTRNVELGETLLQESVKLNRLQMVLSAYELMGRIAEQQGDTAEAFAWYSRDLEGTQDLSKLYPFPTYRRDLSVICTRLGRIREQEGRLTEANEWYMKGLRLNMVLTEETGHDKDYYSLAITCEHLGNICMKKRAVPEARSWYLKENEIFEHLSKTYEMVNYGGRKAPVCRDIGRTYLEENDLPIAEQWFMKAYEILKDDAEKTGSLAAKRSLAGACGDLGLLCEKKGDTAKAIEWQLKRLDLLKEFGGNTDLTPQTWLDIAAACLDVGRLHNKEKNTAKAKEWYRKVVRIAESVSDQTRTAQSRNALFAAYHHMGELCRMEGNASEARAWFLKELKVTEPYARETKTAEAVRDLDINYFDLGTVSEEDPEAALRWYEKELKLRETLAKNRKDLKSRRELTICYERLGDKCREWNDLPAALNWYTKSFQELETLVGETGTSAVYGSLYLCCDTLGQICEDGEMQEEARSWYLKSLEVAENYAKAHDSVYAWDDIAVACSRLKDCASSEDDRRGYLRRWLEVSKLLRERTGDPRYDKFISMAESDPLFP